MSDLTLGAPAAGATPPAQTPPAQNTPPAGQTPPANTPPAADPKPGDPNFEAWLDAKAKAELGTPPAVEPKPEHVPAKFYDATTGKVDYAGMAKSYAELERKLSSGKPAETPPAQTPPAAKPGETPPATPPAGAIDYAKYTQEIVQSGELSEASFAELEAKGMPKAMVQAYIAGQQALQASQTQALLASVGGQSQFDAMKTWAVANLSAAEIARFDKQVTADRDTAQTALEWLNAKFVAANGRGPKVTIDGSTSGAAASGGFASQYEAIKAMQDPRYDKDPAYRAQVDQRLKTATF